MLRPSAHSVACCCVLLGVVAQSLKPVKLWANNSQHFFWSVIAEVYNGPFAQLLQQCWGHTHANYKWSTKSSGSNPSHDALQVPTIIHLHTIAKTDATTPNIDSEHCWPNFIVIRSRVYNEPIQRPAPSWLVSVIGRALHRYRRGQGFESRTSLIFFFRLSLRNCKSCVYKCDDHPSFNSLLRSSHIWFSYIHNIIVNVGSCCVRLHVALLTQ